MGKVFYDASMSLDGFITAANPRPEAGLGDDGLQLFDWTNSGDSRNREIVESGMSTGAVIVGRTTYDLSIPYWGADGPLGTARVPTVVISHSVPQDLPEDSVYSFVNEVETAFETAKQLAGDRDVSMVGSKIGQQFLNLGLIDEVSVHLVPVLFGSGTPLFEDLDSKHISLEPIEVIQTPEVIHLRFRVVK
jgi:dihydrofolate reductase